MLNIIHLQNIVDCRIVITSMEFVLLTSRFQYTEIIQF